MDKHIIEVSGLTKRFGSLAAVDGADFKVKQGEVFGFIGPNGSGKSTTIRMLCGILVPTSGSGHVGPFDVVKESERIKDIIGYVAQRFGLYDDLTVLENMRFFSSIYGVDLDDEALNRILVDFKISEYKEVLTRNLSGGTKQKLALACAVSHKPKILFLDEPTAGIDLVSSREIWSMLYEFAKDGTTVFITTHYMNEAERCNRLSFIYGGKIIALGTPQELKERYIKEKILEVKGDRLLTGFIGDLKKLRSVVDISTSGELLYLTAKNADEMKKEIMDFSRTNGLKLQVKEITPSLEDVFVNLTRNSHK